MSARTSLKAWEYRSIDEVLLCMGLSVPLTDTSVADTDIISKSKNSDSKVTFKLERSICDWCNKDYKTILRLKKHQKQCSAVMSETSDSEVTFNVRSTLCDRCDKVFKTAIQLKKHQKKCAAVITTTKGGRSAVDNQSKKTGKASSRSLTPCSSSSKLRTKSPGSSVEGLASELSKNSKKTRSRSFSPLSSGKEKQKLASPVRKKFAKSSPSGKDIKEDAKSQTKQLSEKSIKGKPAGIKSPGGKKKSGKNTDSPSAAKFSPSKQKSERLNEKTDDGMSPKNQGSKENKGGITKQVFKCDLCSKEFNSRMGYNQHHRRSHPKDLPEPSDVEGLWRCDICGSCMSRKTDWHRAGHYGISSDYCKLLGKEGTEKEIEERTRNGIEITKLTRTENEYNKSVKIDVSVEEFVQKYVKNSYQCKVCQKFFTTVFNYGVHYRVHNEVKEELEKVLENTKPHFRCIICQMKCKTRSSMSKHFYQCHKAGSKDISKKTKTQKHTALKVKFCPTKIKKQNKDNQSKHKKVPKKVSCNANQTGESTGRADNDGDAQRQEDNCSDPSHSVVIKQETDIMTDTSNHGNSMWLPLNQVHTVSGNQNRAEISSQPGPDDIVNEMDTSQNSNDDEMNGLQPCDSNVESDQSRVVGGMSQCDGMSAATKINSETINDMNSGPSDNIRSSASLRSNLTCTDRLHERLKLSFDQGERSRQPDRNMTKFANFKITLGSDNRICVLGGSEVATASISTGQYSSCDATSLNNLTNTQIVNEPISESGLGLGTPRLIPSLEAHVMEPLGSQPSEVEPVKILGKSCVSINSPKDSKSKKQTKTLRSPGKTGPRSSKEGSSEKAGPKSSKEGPTGKPGPKSSKEGPTGKAGPKSSKISRESLVKRFERSHTVAADQQGNKNTSELQKEKLVIDNVIGENNTGQNKITDRHRSPKIFLQRLPELVHCSISININDLPKLSDVGKCGGIEKNKKSLEKSGVLETDDKMEITEGLDNDKKHLDVQDNSVVELVSSVQVCSAEDDALDNQSDCEDIGMLEEMDENQAAIIAKQVTELKNTVLDMRKRKRKIRRKSERNKSALNVDDKINPNDLPRKSCLQGGVDEVQQSGQNCNDIDVSQRTELCGAMDEEGKPSEKENFMRQIELSGESSDDMSKTKQKTKVLPCFSPLSIEHHDDLKAKTGRGRLKQLVEPASQNKRNLDRKGSPSKDKKISETMSTNNSLDKQESPSKDGIRKTRQSCVLEDIRSSPGKLMDVSVVISQSDLVKCQLVGSPTRETKVVTNENGGSPKKSPLKTTRQEENNKSIKRSSRTRQSYGYEKECVGNIETMPSSEPIHFDKSTSSCDESHVKLLRRRNKSGTNTNPPSNVPDSIKADTVKKDCLERETVKTNCLETSTCISPLINQPGEVSLMKGGIDESPKDNVRSRKRRKSGKTAYPSPNVSDSFVDKTLKTKCLETSKSPLLNQNCEFNSAGDKDSLITDSNIKSRQRRKSERIAHISMEEEAVKTKCVENVESPLLGQPGVLEGGDMGSGDGKETGFGDTEDKDGCTLPFVEKEYQSNEDVNTTISEAETRTTEMFSNDDTVSVTRNLFNTTACNQDGNVELQYDETSDNLTVSKVLKQNKKNDKKKSRTRKHTLKRLPSRDKEKKSNSLSRKQRESVMTSYIDLLLDGNRNIMPSAKKIDISAFHTTDSVGEQESIITNQSSDKGDNPSEQSSCDDVGTGMQVPNTSRQADDGLGTDKEELNQSGGSDGFDEPDSSTQEPEDNSSQGFDIEAACMLGTNDSVDPCDKGFDLNEACMASLPDPVHEHKSSGHVIGGISKLLNSEKNNSQGETGVENLEILKRNDNIHSEDKQTKEQFEMLQEEQLSPIFPKTMPYVHDVKKGENGHKFSLDDLLGAALKIRNDNDRNGYMYDKNDIDNILNDFIVSQLSDGGFEVEIAHISKHGKKNHNKKRQSTVEKTEPLKNKFVCEHCDELFSSKALYFQHKKKGTCLDLMFEVNCSASSPIHNMAVDLSLTNNQENAKKHVCDYCGLCYKWKKNLSQHLKTHHLQEQQEPQKKLASDGERQKKSASDGVPMKSDREVKVSELKLKIKKLSNSIDSKEKTWTVSPLCKNDKSEKTEGAYMECAQLSENDSSLSDSLSPNKLVNVNQNLNLTPENPNKERVVQYIAEPITESSVDREILSEDCETTMNSSMLSEIQTDTLIDSSAVSDDQVSSSGIHGGKTSSDDDVRGQLDNESFGHDHELVETDNEDKESNFCPGDRLDINNSRTSEAYYTRNDQESVSHNVCVNEGNYVSDDQKKERSVSDNVCTHESSEEEQNILVSHAHETSESECTSQDEMTIKMPNIAHPQNPDAQISSPVMTLDEIMERYPGVFKVCSVMLMQLPLKEKYFSIGNLRFKRIGSNRWRIKGESEDPFKTAEKTFTGSFSVQNDISGLLNVSASCSSQGSQMDTCDQGRKIEKTSRIVIPRSPRKNLTEFEKAISKPKELKKKKRPLERNSSRDDSNSQDGMDFLKKINERVSAKPQNDSILMSSKLAQSIINKKAKEQQDDLSFASCSIEQIEPFETVLASKDKIRRSPVKKKKKVDGNKPIVKKNLSYNAPSDFDIDPYSDSLGNHQNHEPKNQELDQRIIVRKGLEGSSLTTNVQSTLMKESKKHKPKEKQKGLSERFGVIHKPEDGKGSDSVNFKGMKSDEVMKSMFGPMKAKFDKKFRKQPGSEEEKDSTISRKSPLDSIDKSEGMKYRTNPLKDIKQTVVIPSEPKPSMANKKSTILNMLMKMMDTPIENSSDGNLSFSSPNEPGIFSDTCNYKTVTIEDKGNTSKKQVSKEKSSEVPKSSTNRNSTSKTLFCGLPNSSISDKNTSQKSSLSETASLLSNTSFGSKKDSQGMLVVKDRISDPASVIPVGSSSEQKKQFTENEQKKQLTDKDSDVTASDNMSVSSRHSGCSDRSFRKKRLSDASDFSSSRKKIKLSRLPVGENETSGKGHVESHAVDNITSVERSSDPQENLSCEQEMEQQQKDNLDMVSAKDMSSKQQPDNLETATAKDIVSTDAAIIDQSINSSLEKSKQENRCENLISELEPDIETNKKQTEVPSKENVGHLKDMNITLSSVSSEDLQHDTSNEKEESDYKESDMECEGKVNDDNEEVEDSNRESSSESESESSPESEDEDQSDSVSDTESEVSNQEENNAREVSEDETKNQDDQEEELDIFSTNRSHISHDYHEDDAISIVVDESETASFLIAPAREEEERMEAVDRELNELINEDSNSSQESAASRNNKTKMAPPQEKFAVPMTPKLLIYPPGFCFSFLRNNICQNPKTCNYKHYVPSPRDLLRACYKAIETAFKKNDVNRAFDVYQSLREIQSEAKEGSTPKETLGLLLKVAENNWKVDLAFSLLEELDAQNMINEDICNAYVRLSGQNPARYATKLWQLFEMTKKYKWNLFKLDSLTVLIRSFLNLPDMSCLWQVILYAKHYHLRCVPYPLQYQVVERSLRNMNYYHYIEQWVLICEPDLLLKMDRKLRDDLLHLFGSHGQKDCVAKIEESCRYANIQQQLEESYEASSSAYIEEADVEINDCLKTTENYKALYHKIQSCYHTKNWGLLGETFVELCQQGELDNSYYIDAYSVVFLTNIKNPALLVEAFDQFLQSLTHQYQIEAQEDVLAHYDYRSLSYIGNRLLYACQDKQWWIEGQNIILILLKYSVPFYRYTEPGKPLSCITAINISMRANSLDTAYRTILHFDWEKQPKLTVPQLQIEISVLHDLFEQLQISGKPREALKVLGTCFDIINNNLEVKDYFDFIEDINRLLLTALEVGDIHCGCWAFKLHSSAGLSTDLDRRTLRALLTACGENGYMTEAKELYKICKSKSSYPIQSVETPRTIHLTTAMTYVEIKLEIEAYLGWVYKYLCDLQMDGNILEPSNFFLRVQIEWVNDPAAHLLPYLCRVPRTEMAAYSMVQNLLMVEFGMEGRIDECQGYTYVYVISDHVQSYLEKLDAQRLRQGFRVRTYRPSIK